MSVCQTINCDAKAMAGSEYCEDCYAYRSTPPERRARRINWWAVFLIVAALFAYYVLTWSGHR